VGLKLISVMIKFHGSTLPSSVLKDIFLQREGTSGPNQPPLVGDLVYEPKNLPLVEILKLCAFMVRNLI